MEMIIDVLADALADCLKMLPFLFVAFLLIEGLEHYSTKLTRKALEDVDKAGPVVGALVGCVPQCGFSVMASNLYAGGIISVGTLLSVFLATSANCKAETSFFFLSEYFVRRIIARPMIIPFSDT